MSLTKRVLRLMFTRPLLLAALILPGVALGQSASMTLYVFKQGLPTPDIEVLVDGRVVDVTNENGVVVLKLVPGLQQLELRDQDLVVLSQPLIITEDEVSQWIVNITRGLSALTDIESSGDQAGLLSPAASMEENDGDRLPGTLVGRLINADDGEPVEGARIFISGQSRDVRSNDKGEFEIDLPPGSYSISVLHSGFNTVTRDNVEVLPELKNTVDLELIPTGTELPEFVVIEPYIAGSLASVLEERRTEAAVANILGAEQISKAGDSDAAGALRRVTGLTLVDGRFIYIRGLGERYSSTLLNGANVPSPDATRRVVPLDLFPTGIVDSIAVKKGYTANLPGEFGGGTVELRTKSVPDEPFLTFEVSMGYRDGTTFKDGLRYDGGGRDWAGYDDGTREQPQALHDATADGTRLRPFNRFTGEGFTREELELIGESLSVNYDIYEEGIDPNLGASLAGGYVWNLGDQWRIGFTAASEWGDEWLSVTQQRTQWINAGSGVLESENDLTYRITGRSIDFSGFFTTGVEYGENHGLSYNWMMLRNSTDRAQIAQGFNKDAEGGDVRFYEMEWIEREMEANQLIGRHVFPALLGLKLDWQYTDAVATSDTPDSRSYRYDPDRSTPTEDDFIFSIRNDSNQRRWGELEDSSESWNVDFQLPIALFDDGDVTLMAGLNEVEKDRESSIRRFAFTANGPIARDLNLRRNLSVEDIIFDETIDPRGWQLGEVTLGTDNYTAEQSVEAWYYGIDFNLGDWLRLAAGVRNETSDQSVITFDLFDPERNPIVSTLETDDDFPFVSGTLYLGDHQIRAGYSETTNRPDFKELSPAQYRDPLLDRIVVGNPDLVPAYITHFDLRWDYYFTPSEFVSLGVFYKEFDDPIESVILASADAELASFDNAETAENFGIELEMYKNLDFFDKWWGWGAFWERMYINTNYAWIDSEITLPDDGSSIQTSDSRPLQGQSPYVLNFQLGYDDEGRDINTALLFNIFGKRIVDVGVSGAPDIYEQPRPSVDFLYAQAFGGWKVKFKAKNLLDPDIELSQGPEATRYTEGIGREYSIAVEYKF